MWIELHKHGTGMPILRNVDSIQHILNLESHASVDGEDVVESYEEVKKLLMRKQHFIQTSGGKDE